MLRVCNLCNHSQRDSCHVFHIAKDKPVASIDIFTHFYLRSAALLQPRHGQVNSGLRNLIYPMGESLSVTNNLPSYNPLGEQISSLGFGAALPNTPAGKRTSAASSTQAKGTSPFNTAKLCLRPEHQGERLVLAHSEAVFCAPKLRGRDGGVEWRKVNCVRAIVVP